MKDIFNYEGQKYKCVFSSRAVNKQIHMNVAFLFSEGMVRSKGPQRGIKPVATAARTQPLCMGHPLHHLSYQSTLQKDISTWLSR